MKELELKKPITAHGETLSVLEFDEPTGKDVRELGYPYQMNQDESVRLLAHVVSKYIVRLAKVPQNSLSLKKTNECCGVACGWFFPPGLTAEYLTDRFFDCASYWRINPFELLNMPISEIPLLVSQANRIEQEKRTHGEI